MSNPPKFWFPAKKYGWGWGMPRTWQGMLVLLTFSILLVAGTLLFDAESSLVVFLCYVGILSGALLAICWRKGEPTRWRWGEE